MSAANPYEVELRRFVDCMAGKADPALLDAERAIEAIILSIATQRVAERRTIEVKDYGGVISARGVVDEAETKKALTGRAP